MAKFTMKFNGLILHHAEGNNAKTAVLVDDPQHKPKLVIPASVAPIENGWAGTISGSDREYDLKDCTVSIENIDTSPMDIDPSFTKSVPSLQAVLETPDLLVDEVRQKKIKSNVTAAFVEYSGGKISVVDCFESEVVFDPAVGGDPRCIGRTIQFTGSTTTGSTIKILNGKGGSIVLPDLIEIEIKNTSGGGVDHHKEYKRLTKNGKAPRTMVRTVRTCATCVPMLSAFVELNEERTAALLSLFPELRESFQPLMDDLRGMFVIGVRSVSIECSNSQWP